MIIVTLRIEQINKANIAIDIKVDPTTPTDLENNVWAVFRKTMTAAQDLIGGEGSATMIESKVPLSEETIRKMQADHLKRHP